MPSQVKHINLEGKDIKQIHKKIHNIIIPQPEGLDEWRAEDSIQGQKAAFQSDDTGRAWQGGKEETSAETSPPSAPTILSQMWYVWKQIWLIT